MRKIAESWDPFSPNRDVLMKILMGNWSRDTAPTAPVCLGALMGGWYADTPPTNDVGIFVRWGSYPDLTKYDYVTSKSCAEISSKSLYNNWDEGKRNGKWYSSRSYELDFLNNFTLIFEPK